MASKGSDDFAEFRYQRSYIKICETPFSDTEQNSIIAAEKDNKQEGTDMTIIKGEKDQRGKGYGKEAGHLLLTHTFHTLGFHRISVGIVAFNKPAIKYWKSLGFKKEGVEREEYYCDNKYSDFIMMSILENEYKQPTKKK